MYERTWRRGELKQTFLAPSVGGRGTSQNILSDHHLGTMLFSPIRRRATPVRSWQRVGICTTTPTVIPIPILPSQSIAPRRRPRSRGVLSDQPCHRKVTADRGQSKRSFPFRVWSAEGVRTAIQRTVSASGRVLRYCQWGVQTDGV